MQKKNAFLAKRPENSNFNQYWFSQATIEMLVLHIQDLQLEFLEKHQRPMICAFVSTPSVYCTLKNKDNCYLFEFDDKFKTEKGFVFYDFNKPLDVKLDADFKFDFILIDPPFITEEVWYKYAQTAKHFSHENTKYLLCSIKENDKMLNNLLGVDQRICKPSIPNLIYQYNFYSNYNHETLDQINPEIGF